MPIDKSQKHIIMSPAHRIGSGVSTWAQYGDHHCPMVSCSPGWLPGLQKGLMLLVGHINWNCLWVERMAGGP